MQNGTFIWLLNPAVSIVLSAAFLIVWSVQRQQKHLLVIAAAYLASAGGFLLQAVVSPEGSEATKLVSNTLFILGGVLLSAAITSRFGRRVPWIALGVFAACGLASFAWFLLLEPNLIGRIYAINFALGGMSLVVAAELRPVIRRGIPAKILLVLALLGGLNFLVRPVITTAFGPLAQADLAQSLYWTTAVLSHGILSLMVALSLLGAAAVDIVTQLRREAHIDKLGGILNRRGFEEAASAMVERALARSLPVTVLLADLDNFKSINDLHGHDVGDNVIVAFSTLIAAAEASGGIVARIGGDEFAIVLAVDINTGRLFAEGVRAAFGNIPVSGLPAITGLSASFGLSSHTVGEPISAVLRRADEALYRAKRSGRDCVRTSYRRVATGPLAAAG